MRHCEIWTSLGCTRSVILQSKDDVRRDHCSQWRCLPCWLLATRSLVLLLLGLFGWLFGRLFGWLFFVPLLFQERSDQEQLILISLSEEISVTWSRTLFLAFLSAQNAFLWLYPQFGVGVWMCMYKHTFVPHTHIHVRTRINQWLCSWELSPEHLDTLLSRVS